jgi:Ca2+-binding EF-hand superfamily protein
VHACPDQAGIISMAAIERWEQTGERLFDRADINNAGEVTRREAVGTTNFLIGGLFARADEDGNGVVTPREAWEMRTEMLNQRPILRAAVEAFKQGTGDSPFRTIAQIVDVEYGQPVTREEARRAARESVNVAFNTLDVNHDDRLDSAELKVGVSTLTASATEAAFGSADADKTGDISLGEFEAALLIPARTVFAMADKNDDRKLSPEEARQATLLILHQIGTPYLMELPRQSKQPQPKATPPERR